MPQVNEINPTVLLNVQQLIRTCDTLKQQDLSDAAKRTRLFTTAGALDLPLNNDIVDFMLETNPIEDTELYTKLHEPKNKKKINPYIPYLGKAFIVYMAPHYFTLPIVQHTINNSDKLSPLFKNLLESILYPSVLFMRPRSLITPWTHKAIEHSLRKFNVPFTKSSFMASIATLNYTLGENAPAKLIENEYLPIYAEFGYPLLITIGAINFLSNLDPKILESAHQCFLAIDGMQKDDEATEDALHAAHENPDDLETRPSLFACAERFFEEMHGMQDEDEDKEKDHMTVGEAAARTLGWGFDLMRRTASYIVPAGLTSAANTSKSPTSSY